VDAAGVGCGAGASTGPAAGSGWTEPIRMRGAHEGTSTGEGQSTSKPDDAPAGGVGTQGGEACAG
jgi:hypothetical protein